MMGAVWGEMVFAHMVSSKGLPTAAYLWLNTGGRRRVSCDAAAKNARGSSGSSSSVPVRDKVMEGGPLQALEALEASIHNE